jgi:flavorubredoxin
MKKSSKISALKFKLIDYDTIFIGQPVWAWNMVPAIRALLTKYSFRKKKVMLFATQDGSGGEGCIKETRKLLIGADVAAHMVFTKPRKDEDILKKVKKFIK